MGEHGKKAVLHHRLKNTLATIMAMVTTSAWLPFTENPEPVQANEEDETTSVPEPIFETHSPPTWPEKAVPHVNLVKRPRPPTNPATSPTHARPTPKVPVRIKPIPAPPPPPSASQVDILITFLRAQLGKQYVFGGNGPDVWDCSGLTKAAYARVGIHLPRTSEQQSLVGERVPLTKLLPGDLVFWGAVGIAFHVGVYVGGGRVIAAQNPASGVVQFTTRFYPPNFARRVL